MKTISIAIIAAMLGFVAEAAAADLSGWTRRQLEVKVMQLSKENKKLKAKLATAAATGAVAGEQGAKPPTNGPWLIDNFEGPQAPNGKAWWSGCDSHGMGTKLDVVTVTGKKGKAMNLKGFFPKNEAPWPYASSNIELDASGNAVDLTGFKALEFWVKGDGKNYKIQLDREDVKDFAHFEFVFAAPASWTKVTIPMKRFAQPSWGQKVNPNHTAVKKISIAPAVENTTFNVAVDEMTFTK